MIFMNIYIFRVVSVVTVVPGLNGTTSAFKQKLITLLSVQYLFGTFAGLIEVPAAVQ